MAQPHPKYNPLEPDRDLLNQLKEQEKIMHESLRYLNSLYEICNNENFNQKSTQNNINNTLDKLHRINPALAKELSTTSWQKDPNQLMQVIENNRQELTEQLEVDLEFNKKIENKINQERNNQMPTDS